MTRKPFAIVIAALLAGCGAVPKEGPQVAQVRPTALGLSIATPSVSARWWDDFGDPQLGTLIDMGLAGNPNLEGALARLRAAQAQIAVQHAGQLPQVTADAGLQVERFSENYIIPPPYGGATYSVPSLAANLSWDLDLFGRQRARVAQARASALAAQYDADAARLTISTAIAQTYAGLVQANRQIAIADNFVSTRQQALGYVRSRIKHQLASNYDARTAETLLAEAQQAKVRAERQRDLMIHALAALVGRGADFYPQIATPTLSLDALPAVPAELPADLLGRRPDLLAGQARIDAAVSGRAVAKADFMPNVNITALASLASLGLGSFFTAGSVQPAAGAAIHLPIFEGGRLKAQYRGATADLDSAVADYNGSVIEAVKASADAITSVRSVDADLAAQQRVVHGLRETVRLDQVRTSTGLGSKLDAIDSGFRLLEAEQQLADVQASALTNRIKLIAALGGGFDARTAVASTQKGSGL
ncbi:efflux transporter outer membrane subunit [Sphingomonas immobilis]|uniref:Efflux transporter outer membrane subunit n=1 Tax=Sphingomonas immobilis TaxID=3063997 RepID=A0ABT9A2R1_9SPHN|nr:efflux transporter outer membrane subunit [Sphingomonas sp. CA1-15]MDO7844125.1 efflux transporter outer membrane subunit [Sphingomonas sp. CA1-15]